MNKDLERLLELYHKNRDDNGILMSKDEWKEYQTLKSKLESQLLSEGKYESLMEANSQVVQDNITMSQYQQQIKELQEMCKECDIKYEELWASNWKLKAVIDEINLGIDKILDMNQEDYNFYTKQELRNIKEILKKVESK